MNYPKWSVEAGPGIYSQIIEGQKYTRIVYNSRLEIMFKVYSDT